MGGSAIEREMEQLGFFMNESAPSPLDVDALFLRLALVERLLTPDQVRQMQHILAQRSLAQESTVSAERVCREHGLLTAEAGERLVRRARALAGAPTGQGLAAPPDSKRLRKLHAQEDLAALAAGVSGFKLEADAPPVIVGGHRLLKRIGRGGMGEVYKALQLNMDRVVALKILTPRLAKDEKYIARFRREARAAGRLNHPNLVLVYDVGEDAGKHYFSMEYVEGRTVKEVLKREGRFTPASALTIIEQIAAALECAHRGKIIHRDIKPDNILLTANGTAKLADLGLAKVLEGSLHESETQAGVTMGTPRYMSPEQARAEASLDHRADLYSLGATLYHMLTGEAPFDGSSSLDILLKVLREPPPRPDRLEPLLPPPLTQLVLRLLAKDPAERPQTAAGVWREVRALRDDLEAGRVFIFNDTPVIIRGTPRLAPSAVKKAVSKIPAFSLALVLFSAVASALYWAAPGAAAVAPPPPPLFFHSPPESQLPIPNPPEQSSPPSPPHESPERTGDQSTPPAMHSRIPPPSGDAFFPADEGFAAAGVTVHALPPPSWLRQAHIFFGIRFKNQRNREFFFGSTIGATCFNFAYTLNYPKGVSYSSPGQRPGVPMQIGSTPTGLPSCFL
jgi:serine/threonine protein kinase